MNPNWIDLNECSGTSPKPIMSQSDCDGDYIHSGNICWHPEHRHLKGGDCYSQLDCYDCSYYGDKCFWDKEAMECIQDGERGQFQIQG